MGYYLSLNFPDVKYNYYKSMICGHWQKEKILGWIQMNVYFGFWIL